MSSHPPTASSIGPPHIRKENPGNVLLDRCGTDQSVGIAKKVLMFGQAALDKPVVNRTAVPDFEETFSGPRVARSSRTASDA